MKKFVLALLAVVLVLGLSAVAFADHTCTSAVTKEVYKIDGEEVAFEDIPCGAEYRYQVRCAGCDYLFNGVMKTKDHTWGETKTVEPTCEEGGYDITVCEVCGEEVITNEVDPLGHWDAEIGTGHDQPSFSDCTLNFEADIYCTRCGKKTGTWTFDGNDSHNWVLVNTIEEATCVKGGKVEEKCANKGCTATRTRNVSAGQHDYELIKRDIAADPCAVNSMDYWECDICGDDKVVYKYGIVYKNGTDRVISIVEYGKGDENIDWSARNHTYKDGSSAWHNNDHIVTFATCTTAGQREQECDICGAKKVVAYGPLGHDFDNWVVKVEPRCTTNGMKVRHCTRPGCWDYELHNAYQEVEVIPATGHILGVDSEVAATCTEDGSKTGRCALCEQLVTETVKATGHAYGEWTIKDGLKYKVCANCNDIVVEAATPVVPETPADPEDKPSSGNGGSSNTGNGGSSSTGSGSDASIPATGDNTSNAPYIMMVAAVAGLVVLVASKRKVNC